MSWHGAGGCLAKSLGGGVAVAAIGGTRPLMDHVASGGDETAGTFDGDPLAMAAARAMLTEVATGRAYARIEALRQRAAAGISAVINDFRMNGFVVTSGAKGCVVFAAADVRDYRGFLAVGDSLPYLRGRGRHITPAL